MLLSLTAFSQIDTKNKIDTTAKLSLPIRIGRLAVIDLIKGDECKEALASSQTMVDILRKLNKVNNDQIKIYEDKINLYKTEISLYQEKETKYIEVTQCLESKLKKTKRINYFLSVACSALAVTAGACFLLN